LANSKTQNAFLFTVYAIFRHDYPLAVEPASTPRPLVQKETLRDSLPIDMLLSAVSVLVVGHASSEIPEGLMNNPVYMCCYFPVLKTTARVMDAMEPRNRPAVAQRVPGGLDSQISMTFGTLSWWGFQPHAPAAFTPRKFSWYSFSLGAESTPGPWFGRKEYVTKKSSDTTGNRSRDRPTSRRRLNHYATPGPMDAVTHW